MLEQLAQADETSAIAGGEGRDPYREPLLALVLTAFLGVLAALAGGIFYGNPLLLDAALALGVACALTTGVFLARRPRLRPEPPPALDESPAPPAPDSPRQPSAMATPSASRVLIRKLAVQAPGMLDLIRLATALGGLFGVVFLLLAPLLNRTLPLPRALLGIVLCLAAVGLPATAARYLTGIADGLPEARNLARGARVIAWILATAAAGFVLAWAGRFGLLRALHWIVLAVIAAFCGELVPSRRSHPVSSPACLRDTATLTVLGGRANLLASVLDAGERQLGIDLRSTWALTVVRRSLAPLLLGLCVLAWLSTSLTVVGVEELGLAERLGVPAAAPPLGPGLHAHFPWPVDRVIRIPVARIQTVQVGHEGEEAAGPENVLWAVEHAPNEYTLVLGNGRDLVTVDAAVQYRIVDARAWHYNLQNPELALRAIAYRAVMKATVNRTLEDVLSQNLARVTAQMRDDVQRDADALGLGVQVLRYTVGGMHPPVPVAAEYEAVVSAQLAKVTAVVNAQVYRNQIVPAATAQVLFGENVTRAQGAQDLALAAGQAWSFRTLEAQYHAAPAEYMFRRRLETLESRLPGLKYTIIDARYLRDGGELWFTP